jgi:hypothetical protein
MFLDLLLNVSGYFLFISKIHKWLFLPSCEKVDSYYQNSQNDNYDEINTTFTNLSLTFLSQIKDKCSYFKRSKLNFFILFKIFIKKCILVSIPLDFIGNHILLFLVGSKRHFCKWSSLSSIGNWYFLKRFVVKIQKS